MLNINLTRLSRMELEDAVLAQCAPFGTVASVRILPPATKRSYALAVVAMASTEEAEKVVVNVGDLKFRASAIIRLMPEEG